MLLRGDILAKSYTGRVDAVFFDYEGTLNDSVQSGGLELVGYLKRRYPGHTVEGFGNAVRAALEATRRLPDQYGHGVPWPGYAAYRRRELRLWFETLLRTAGLPIPDGGEALDELAADLAREAAPRFVPMPGAVAALRSLSHTGLRLYIASGATTEYTAPCLRDAGLIGLFDDIFGPDKLDTLKTGQDYYVKCFAAAGVEPRRACVVDDSPGPLRWALELGARAIGLRVPAGLVAAPDGGDDGAAIAERYTEIENLGELTSVLTSANV